MVELGIFQGLPKRIPHLTAHLPICLISESTQLIRQSTVSTKDVTIGTNIKADFTFFNVTSIQGFILYFNVIYDTSSYPFGLPTRPRRPPVSLLKYISVFPGILVTLVLLSILMKAKNLPDHQNP